MSDDLRERAVSAIVSFESSFLDMKLPQGQYKIAYKLLDEAKSEIVDSRLDGAALGLKIRYFYEFFSRELLPGGILLSERARKDFAKISELANSLELLRLIQSPF